MDIQELICKGIWNEFASLVLYEPSLKRTKSSCHVLLVTRCTCQNKALTNLGCSYGNRVEEAAKRQGVLFSSMQNLKRDFMITKLGTPVPLMYQLGAIPGGGVLPAGRPREGQ
eukprot:1161744-Pelagomonas_calceolata.AAC.8